jgi:hypothetical protein
MLGSDEGIVEDSSQAWYLFRLGGLQSRGCRRLQSLFSTITLKSKDDSDSDYDGNSAASRWQQRNDKG